MRFLDAIVRDETHHMRPARCQPDRETNQGEQHSIPCFACGYSPENTDNDDQCMLGLKGILTGRVSSCHCVRPA